MTVLQWLSRMLKVSVTGVRLVLAELASPLMAAWEPIQELLNPANDQDYLTRKWHKSKLEELRFVGLTSAFLASLCASAFSWPAAEKKNTIWPVLALWYAALMFIMASVATATQQSIMLYRLNCHPAFLHRLRNMLGAGQQPRSIQIFIWQIPVMMLRFGILCFLSGVLLMLWHAAWREGQWTSDDLKTASIFTVIAAFSLFCHGLSVFYGYSGAGVGKQLTVE